MSLNKIILTFVALQLLALPVLLAMESSLLANLGILVVVLAAVAFVGNIMGAHNIFSALMFDKKSSFIRKEDKEGEYFYVIKPARISRGGLLGSFGVFLILSVLYPFLFLILSLIFIIPYRVYARGIEYRKPIELRVMPDCVKTQDFLVQRSDVLEVFVVQLFDVNQVAIVTATGQESSGNNPLSKLLWARQAACSYEVRLRSATSSEAYVLAGGLNEGTALALRDDLKALL